MAKYPEVRTISEGKSHEDTALGICRSLPAQPILDVRDYTLLAEWNGVECSVFWDLENCYAGGQGWGEVCPLSQ